MMNKKIVILATAFAMTAGAFAQDIYQMASFSSEDLNGTSRYVGMGGAMSALGADMSTMGTNPAAIGLFRKSDAALTVGMLSLSEGQKFDGKGKTRMSFDNLGIVGVIKLDDSTCKFLNIGFNYHKQKNFKSLLNTEFSPANEASQTWQMADLADAWGEPAKATPLADMGYEAYLINPLDDGGYDAYGASYVGYNKSQLGGIHAFDFNISTNLAEQFYLGLTVGAYNVNYKSLSLYTEDMINVEGVNAGYYDLSNDRELTGNGFNVKFGFIARPVKTSPFRIGLAVSSPTYYNLKYRGSSDLVAYYNDGMEPEHQYTDVDSFRYNIHTPWKFNLSLGHTIANQLAIGAEYEYADYSTAKVTYDDSNDWDWDWSNETDDRELNRQADHYLRGVHTFKVGAEWMVDKSFAIRAGYNHVTSPFDSKAFLNQTINSASLDYATSTNYMNLSGINRWTVGIGYNTGNFYIDAACQYQNQHGNFYAFTTQNGNENAVNDCPRQRLDLSRTQLMLTLGFRF